MDSGTLDSVAPPSILPGVTIKDSEGSRSGQNYGSATGHRAPNLGEQQFVGTFEDNSKAPVSFQIADITRPLLAVGKICDQNSHVGFGKSGGVIYDLDAGRRTNFYRDDDGMYQLDIWVPKDKANAEPSEGFPGPGR